MWKEKSIAQSQPFQVEIHPYLDSHEAGHVWDDLEYKEYSYNEPAKEVPLKIFEAPPPYGKRIVTLQIELDEYRDRFIAKEIGGGFPREGDDKGKYCRVMKSIDISEESEVEKVCV